MSHRPLGWGDLDKIHEKIQDSIGSIPKMGWRQAPTMMPSVHSLTEATSAAKMRDMPGEKSARRPNEP
jgi:hypothetical protein